MSGTKHDSLFLKRISFSKLLEQISCFVCSWHLLPLHHIFRHVQLAWPKSFRGCSDWIAAASANQALNLFFANAQKDCMLIY